MMITKMLLLNNRNYVFGLFMPDKGPHTFVAGSSIVSAADYPNISDADWSIQILS